MITKQSKVLYFEAQEMGSPAVTLVKREYTLHNGMIVTYQDIRRSFFPGDIERVKEFIGKDRSPEIDFLNASWTQQVIDEYNESLSK
jgi:hypothetical protein